MLYEIESLPDAPLDAAKAFHASHLEAIEAAIPHGAGCMIVVFPPACFEHRGWRLAAVQELARAFAPTRVNAIEGGDGAAQLAARDYLESAPGVTGQLLTLDATGAGPVSGG